MKIGAKISRSCGVRFDRIEPHTSRKKLVSEVRKNLYELSKQPGLFNYLNTIIDQSGL